MGLLRSVLILLLCLLLPTSARAQLVEPSAPLPAVQPMVEFDAASFRSPFFEHRHFQFDAGTLEHILTAAPQTALLWADRLAALPGQPFPVLWPLLWRALLTILLAAAAVALDLRMRRTLERLSHELLPIELTGRLAAMRQAGVRLLGATVAPFAGYIACLMMQALFDHALWTIAATDALGFLLAYRMFMALLDELLGGIWFPLPAQAGRRILRVVRAALRVVVVLLMGYEILVAFDARGDVLALVHFAVRGALALLSLRIFTLQRDFLALLPTEGSPRWQIFRAVAATWLPRVLLGTVLLIALWAAGFERAATTILGRLWAIVALVIGAVLLQRWFDTYSRGNRRPAHEVAAALLDTLSGSVRLGLWALFAWLILRQLGLWSVVLVVLDAVGVQIGQSRLTLLKVARALLIIGATIISSRALRTLLERLAYPRLKIDQGAAYAINIALHWFLLAGAVGAALVAVGFDLSALTVFSGALGIGIGLGLQDVAKNLISGFILIFGGSIQKGDLISIGDDVYGYVEKLGGRAAVVRTRDNYELLIPTKDLINSTIVNWTHNDAEARVHIPVGLSYDADVIQAREALIEAARRYEGCLPHRPVQVWLTSFRDSAVEFELLFWINGFDVTPRQAAGEVLFHVWEVLHERGIPIPFPQRDLHLRSVDAPVRTLLRELARTGGDQTPPPPDAH
jgi:small-conductance mechanosensitive channel